MKRRWWRVAAVVVGGPLGAYALALASFAFVPNAEDYAHRIAFDAEAWRSSAIGRDEDPSWPTRLRMVDDLLAKRRLDGLRRDEVEQLLGPGDRTSKWPEWDVVYRLGPERRGLFRLDSEWLVTRFDNGGRVAVYRVVGD